MFSKKLRPNPINMHILVHWCTLMRIVAAGNVERKLFKELGMARYTKFTGIVVSNISFQHRVLCMAFSHASPPRRMLLVDPFVN